MTDQIPSVKKLRKMTNKRLFLIVIICLSILIFLFFTNKYFETVKTPSSQSHPNLFFDEVNFYKGVIQAEKENRTADHHIYGGIIPHHLLPGFIQTDFFHRLVKQKPKTIILIGPNHYEKGKYKILSSMYSWDTPFGTVEPEDTIVSELVKKNVTQIDEDVLTHDHSVAGIMPFIKYYLPETRVVPILMSSFNSREEVEFLADNMKNYMDQDTVLVAAVDFSHYLSNKEAQVKDEFSLEIIKEYDYRRLFPLHNDYMDSPTSIAALLMIMQKINKTKMAVLQHTNSGELTKDDFGETTSYFSIVYY